MKLTESKEKIKSDPLDEVLLEDPTPEAANNEPKCFKTCKFESSQQNQDLHITFVEEVAESDSIDTKYLIFKEGMNVSIRQVKNLEFPVQQHIFEKTFCYVLGL